MAAAPQELRRPDTVSDPPDGGREDRSVYWMFAGPGRRPDPTPSAGPDPYGCPDPEWLGVDWREHLRWADVGGAQVNYAEMGEGPPILFVHGLSGSWQNWLEQLPHFARNHRVIALDLPGFGASPMPPWEISISAYGRLLDDFSNMLGIERATLVGNSMGGFISAEALLFRFQDRSLRRPGLRYAAFKGIFHAPHHMRPELLWEQYHAAVGAPGMVDAVRGLAGYDFTDRLRQVDDPTLIVWGRNDRVVPPKDAAGYAGYLNVSRTAIFDRTGHCAMLERPVRFNRLLEQFIAGQGPELDNTLEGPPEDAGGSPDTVE